MAMKKVLVVTGTRAEFGLLRPLMQGIARSKSLTLQIIATGTHLSPRFGETYTEIEDAGFCIDFRVNMLVDGDSAAATGKSVGLGMIGFADALALLSPDLLVVLGDRFELLCAVTNALFYKIPVAHIHGGETTEGAYDEAIRHSITKMSHLHFVGADEYKRRVIQLGEDPERVFMVGGLGVDVIKNTKLLDQSSLENELGFKFGNRNLLVTFHPVTLSDNSSTYQMAELLKALSQLKGTSIIFTMPNADTGNNQLVELVNAFVESQCNSKIFKSLGHLRYLSCMALVDGVIGNSSSGIGEAPTMKIGTVNIGDRQKGRLMSESVINCEPNEESISSAISQLYSKDFKRVLETVTNPYGDGGAAKKITKIIDSHNLSQIVQKKFHDLPQN